MLSLNILGYFGW